MKHLATPLALLFILFLSALFPLALLFARLLQALGPWMAVSDPLPRRLDALYAYAGEGVRDRYCRNLAEKYPDVLLVPGFKTAPSTHGETRALYRELGERFPSGPDTLEVGLVTGPYHMRRVYYDAKFTPCPVPIRIHCLPVPLSFYGWNEQSFLNWRKNGHLRRLFIFELDKMIYYNFKYWLCF